MKESKEIKNKDKNLNKNSNISNCNSQVVTQSKKNNNTKLIITVLILGILLALMTTLFVLSLQENRKTSLNLEDFYQKNFYELVDNINNTETKLAKTISANDINYQSKLLEEISKNTTLAQVNLNNLPYSINGLDNTVSFINQTSGYCETLSKSLKNGESLTNEQRKTLNNIYDSILNIKEVLNQMSKEMWNGYSIIETSASFDGDYNSFTINLSQIKSNDVEYPTMIYDGPFSDSEVNKKVKGLNGELVGQEQAKQNILKIFSNYNENMVKYINETNGRFATYNFNVYDKNNNEIGYVQMTKIGGKLLTLSSYNDKKSKNLNLKNAEAIALQFAQQAQINNTKVVWSDIVGGNAFVNLAPVQNNIILYPDLIKLKIDLSDGTVLGFEASAYYTNHVKRTLLKGNYSIENAKNKINKNFVIQEERLALIPLDYGQEVLCYEFVCKHGGDDYYFYINTTTGVEENILKIIQTDNGSLLM